MFGHRIILDARDEFHAAHRLIDIVEREPEGDVEIIRHLCARPERGHMGVGHVHVPRRILVVTAGFVDHHRKDDVGAIAAQNFCRVILGALDSNVVAKRRVEAVRVGELTCYAAQHPVGRRARDRSIEHPVIHPAQFGNAIGIGQVIHHGKAVGGESFGHHGDVCSPVVNLRDRCHYLFQPNLAPIWGGYSLMSPSRCPSHGETGQISAEIASQRPRRCRHMPCGLSIYAMG